VGETLGGKANPKPGHAHHLSRAPTIMELAKQLLSTLLLSKGSVVAWLRSLDKDMDIPTNVSRMQVTAFAGYLACHPGTTLLPALHRLGINEIAAVMIWDAIEAQRPDASGMVGRTIGIDFD
jgi:hypothetical protein